MDYRITFTDATTLIVRGRLLAADAARGVTLDLAGWIQRPTTIGRVARIETLEQAPRLVWGARVGDRDRDSGVGGR
jgi:hypothetical protein